jgi:hypothetical protein
MTLKGIALEFLVAAPEAGPRLDGGYENMDYITAPQVAANVRFDIDEGDLPTWADAMLLTAFACATEDDLANLRVRLLELGGICAHWIADIDARIEDAA